MLLLCCSCQGLTLSFLQSDDVVSHIVFLSKAPRVETVKFSVLVIKMLKQVSAPYCAAKTVTVYFLKTVMVLHKQTLNASFQMQFSSQWLFHYLRGIERNAAALTQFGDSLLLIFRENLHSDRYTHTQKYSHFFPDLVRCITLGPLHGVSASQNDYSKLG